MFAVIKSIMEGVLSLRNKASSLGFSYVVTEESLDIIKKFEGFSGKAYLDPDGVWTIGYGNTFYEDGTAVKQGDKISRARAEELLRSIAKDFANEMSQYIRVQLNTCQFNALLSFVYNIGINQFKRSTILRKINANPLDPKIAYEFSRWVRISKQKEPLSHLVKRRKEESDLYFKKCD